MAKSTKVDAIDTLEELKKPLPDSVVKAAFKAGDYPYNKKLKLKKYNAQNRNLQIELVKFQRHNREVGGRVVALFEGRDAAGKGGTIKRFAENLNPRHAKVVALSKPTETEQGEWYFQRYINHLPTAGDIALLDRSWYNRAGVEKVFGFCSDEQYGRFLVEVPEFERMIQRDGIRLFKFWLTIGQETQIKRFHDRATDPLKTWKLSPIDIGAMKKWDDYTAAKKAMMKATHTADTPWTVIKANDKRRARLNAMRHFLQAMDYAGKDIDAIGEIDPSIVGTGAEEM